MRAPHLFALAATCLFAQPGSAVQESRESKPAQPTDGIRWRHDLDRALADSATDGRPVIAYFTFNACVWCKRLEENTYSDPSVIELSRKFIWVKVNRDDTPEIPPQFSVTAYPSLITLGTEREKIHRFSGYKLPSDFIPELEEALRRYSVYKAGGAWEPVATRPDAICDAGSVELIPAPSEANPSGMVVLNGDLWIMQHPTLSRMNLASGRVVQTFQAPTGSLIVDLATDGTRLYMVEYGWSAGKPIYVFDPKRGEVTREIVTEANKENRSHSTRGVAFLDGSLWVLSGLSGTIHRVDPATGEVLATLNPEATRLSSLDVSRGAFISGSKDAIIYINPETGEVITRVATNYGLRSVATDGSSLYLMEQPVWDYDINNQRVRVWPKQMMIYKLILDGGAG